MHTTVAAITATVCPLAYGYPELVPNANTTKPSAAASVPESSPFDRILAFMIVGLVSASIVAFIAVIVATQLGIGANDGFSHGVWPVVLMLPLFALPVAFLLLVVLIIRGVGRRSRMARDRYV